MNVAVSFNDQFLRYACVALTSLLENCASPISVHVLTADLSAASEDALRRLFAPFPNAELAIERVDDSVFKGIDMSNTHLSKETFFRFLLPSLFPPLPDRQRNGLSGPCRSSSVSGRWRRDSRRCSRW